MTVVRLFVSEPLGRCERVRYRFPLRIGRDPRNDFQLVHPAVAQFHVELDRRADVFVLRDVGVRNDVLVRVGGEMRDLRGRELSTAADEIEFAIAGMWLRACVEVSTAHPIGERALQAAEDILTACRQSLGEAGDDTALRALVAVKLGAVALRRWLKAELDHTEAQRSTLPADVVSGLMHWAQALIGAVDLARAALDGRNDSDGLSDVEVGRADVL